MPMKPRSKQHERRYSWPPFKMALPQKKKDIDEDPFSFFLSPVEDGDTISPGTRLDGYIEADSRSRSLSPRLAQNKHKILQSPTLHRLKRWMRSMEARYLHPQSASTRSEVSSLPTPPGSPVTSTAQKRPAPIEEIDEPMYDVFDIPASPPIRGRRPRPTNRRRYHGKIVRSHSKRARVWQEPTEDIWPVLEEPEEIGLGIRLS